MIIDTVTDKNLQELERLSKELLEAMRKAKVEDEMLTDALRRLNQEASDIRRSRFDAHSPEFRGF
jgi:predicted  nucleic acid-binding Zn-ribbon protein